MSLNSAEGVIPNQLAAGLQGYPDKNYTELKKAFAKYLNVRPTQLAVGCGVEGVILFTLLTFRKGKAVFPTPTFYLYRTIPKIIGMDSSEVYCGPEFKVSADKILKEKPELLILVSPNNPTGNPIYRAEIIKLLNSASCPVILDEVYAELSGTTNLDLLQKYKNLIILRSLSKSFSLAGARIGFAIGDEKLIQQIEQTRLATIPYPISTTSVKAALAALKNPSFTAENRLATETRRKVIADFNQLPGIKAYQSKTNFFLLEADRGQEQKVRQFCSDCTKFGLPSNFFRIGLSDEAAIKKLLEALK